MKTYMIPCFMLVRAADEAHAYDKVYQVQRGERRIFIYQDETLQAKVYQVQRGERRIFIYQDETLQAKVYQVQRGERRIFIYQDETLQAKEVNDDAEYHTILDVYSKEELK